MAPSKLWKAIGAVKDHTSIGLAKVGSSSSISGLEVAIVKATRHEETPPDDRYINEIVSMTSCSRALVNSTISTIARRLNKTRNWVVALKTLMLVQRLISEGGHVYEEEIFFATRRGARFLNMSDFLDSSHDSDAWDYSAFVHTYALYLDQQLEFKMQGRRRRRKSGRIYNMEGEDDRGSDGNSATSNDIVMSATPVNQMAIEVIFSLAHHMKQLLERLLACKPTGTARHNRVVAMSLYPIVKESFKLYDGMKDIMSVLTARFMELEVPVMVDVYEIFCRVSMQYDELDAFYDWCKSAGIGRCFEYPDIEKISHKKLDMMEDIIHQKSAMSNKRRTWYPERSPKHIGKVSEPKPGHNIFDTQPEAFLKQEESHEEISIEKDKPRDENKICQEMGDLLNLYKDASSTQEQGDKPTSASTSTGNTWEAFPEFAGNQNHRTTHSGGFDTLIHNGMYQQEATTRTVASAGAVASGSPSSGTLGSPTALVLPAASAAPDIDPFSASLAISPPPYVQMAEMEKKQRFLVQEQLAWQQYTRDAMQGQMLQQQYPYGYITGGYARRW